MLLFTETLLDRFVDSLGTSTSASSWKLLATADRCVVQFRLTQASEKGEVELRLEVSTDGLFWTENYTKTIAFDVGQSFEDILDMGSAGVPGLYARLFARTLGPEGVRVRAIVTGRARAVQHTSRARDLPAKSPLASGACGCRSSYKCGCADPDSAVLSPTTVGSRPNVAGQVSRALSRDDPPQLRPTRMANPPIGVRPLGPIVAAGFPSDTHTLNPAPPAMERWWGREAELRGPADSPYYCCGGVGETIRDIIPSRSRQEYALFEAWNRAVAAVRSLYPIPTRGLMAARLASYGQVREIEAQFVIACSATTFCEYSRGDFLCIRNFHTGMKLVYATRDECRVRRGSWCNAYYEDHEEWPKFEFAEMQPWGVNAITGEPAPLACTENRCLRWCRLPPL